MPTTHGDELKVAELLNAANKHYDGNYLSVYFDNATGRCKPGAGDTLAEFIVCELRETFDRRCSREQQVAVAVRVLERAKRDIQKAINGLREL